MKKAWRGFTGTKWLDEVNMRQFIQDNYESYDGDASFLEEPTAATNKLWGYAQRTTEAGAWLRVVS